MGWFMPGLAHYSEIIEYGKPTNKPSVLEGLGPFIVNLGLVFIVNLLQSTKNAIFCWLFYYFPFISQTTQGLVSIYPIGWGCLLGLVYHMIPQLACSTPPSAGAPQIFCPSIHASSVSPNPTWSADENNESLAVSMSDEISRDIPDIAPISMAKKGTVAPVLPSGYLT